MALDRTSGFDLLIQLSEADVNSQLAAAFDLGRLFPAGLSLATDDLGIAGTLNLGFIAPVADFDRPRPQVGLRVGFNGSLEIETPSTTFSPLDGTIEVVAALVVRAAEGTQQVGLDFATGAPTATVTFDTETAALLAPLLGSRGLTVVNAQNRTATLVLDRLRTDLGWLPLSPAIAVGDDSDPLTPFSVEVTTVNDETAADRDALVIGVRTDAASGGNILAVTESFIPAGGSQALVMVSNFWLLARVIRPQLATALGLMATDFDTPLRLNHAVAVLGGGATLTHLEARVEGNRLRADGRATASGTGWSAAATFTFFVDLTISGGQLRVTASTPSIQVDVNLEWWVWLLSLGAGGLFGGLVGTIVGAILPAVAEAIAEGLVRNLGSTAFSSVAGSIPPLPLGPIGSGLSVASVVLDDLELRGSIHRSLDLPVRSAGQHVAAGAFALDLDSGTLYPETATAAAIDLAWDPFTGLDARHGAGLTVTGAPYGALTPLELRTFDFATTRLGSHAIPVSSVPGFFGTHREVAFGVRTNQGRLAKVRAWREVWDGGALHLEWTTFDNPIPTLDVALRWSLLEIGESRGDGICTRSEVSRRCAVEAWPRRTPFPVTYQWCLCGTILTEGEGVVEHAGGTLSYRLSGRRLTLDTEMSGAVDCELCVSSIDARGRELFTCVRLAKDGGETACDPLPRLRFKAKPDLVTIPSDPETAIDAWESLDSPRVREHLLRALEEGKTAAAR